MARVVVVGAYPASVVDFRGDMLREFVRRNHDVTMMTAPATQDVQEGIEQLGVRFRPYPVQRNSLNLLRDRRTLAELRTAFTGLQPDVILAYTIKPIIWGGIAARRCPQARFFALVTGLGYAFQGKTLKRRLLSAAVTRLYRFALKHATAVLFQNSDNRDVFVRRRIVPREKCYVVNGSGINLTEYAPTLLPDGPAHFLLIARLLNEKGIREFRRAAEIVRTTYPDAKFSLVGPEDPSPDGISTEEVMRWHDAGRLTYHGSAADVRPFLRDCHVYCLPSYHEGMPRTVLEAMATGRPILTTDVAGCRETVEPGGNGWLVPHADAEALAERMIWFLENRDRWQTMGDASRRMAEEKFDVRKVNEQMLKIMGLDGETDN